MQGQKKSFKKKKEQLLFFFQCHENYSLNSPRGTKIDNVIHLGILNKLS